jgi:hypothetical protein
MQYGAYVKELSEKVAESRREPQNLIDQHKATIFIIHIKEQITETLDRLRKNWNHEDNVNHVKFILYTTTCIRNFIYSKYNQYLEKVKIAFKHIKYSKRN